jgi:hypothetical protein
MRSSLIVNRGEGDWIAGPLGEHSPWNHFIHSNQITRP